MIPFVFLRTAAASAIAAWALIPAPCVAAASASADREDLDKALAEARERLDEAAREVADLSRRLYGGFEGDVVRFVGARGAMLGVNIGSDRPRDDGVEIVGVSPGGPAEAAGLRPGDIIVAVDGKTLKRSGDATPSSQLVRHLRGVEPGAPVKVDYLRAGKRQTASVKTMAARPPLVDVLGYHAMPMIEGVMPKFEAFLGPGRAFGELELVGVTPKLGRYFGTDKGLLVVRAPQSSAYQLEDGDVLISIDGRVPESPGHAFRILRSYQPGEKLKIELLRDRRRHTVEVTVPEDHVRGGGRPMPMPAPRPAVPPPPPLPPPAVVPAPPPDDGPV